MLSLLPTAGNQAASDEIEKKYIKAIKSVLLSPFGGREKWWKE